jgi:hypothetical protein
MLDAERFVYPEARCGPDPALAARVRVGPKVEDVVLPNMRTEPAAAIKGKTLSAAVLIGLAVLVCVNLVGCGVIQRLTGEAARKQARAEEAKEQSQTLQLKVMRFADHYVERIARRADQLVADYATQLDSREEIDALRAKIADEQFIQATAAYQIAAGTNPVANAVDMVVLVSLSRRIVEYDWWPRYGAAAEPLLRTYRSLEEQAWYLVDDIASPARKAELEEVMRAWYEANPQLQSAAFVRFTDVAALGRGAKETPVSPGLLGIVGLDPLEGVDPAIREVEQSRILAERALYYAQRTPILIDFQLSTMFARASQSDYGRETLQTIDQVGQLSESLSRLTTELPQLVAREREAAIAQLMAELYAQHREMLALTKELRGALDAGTLTAESLDALVKSTDRLMERFAPDPDAMEPTEPPRPFDINEYTRTITELAATAREFQALVQDVDALTPEILDRVDLLAERAQGLVDYAFWRLVAFVLVLLAAAMVYRLAAGRIGRSAGRT